MGILSRQRWPSSGAAQQCFSLHADLFIAAQMPINAHRMCMPCSCCCRQAGKDNASQNTVQAPHFKQPCRPRAQPAAAAELPNIQFHAYSMQHTQQMYAARYHSLPELLDCNERHAVAVLQSIVDSQILDDSVISGVSILQREHPQLSSHLVWHPCGHLVWHPCGKHILNEAAMRTVPQNGCAWHLVRHGCVTASSNHLFLGFHGRDQRPFSTLQAQRSRRCCTEALSAAHDDISHNAFFRWGHEHEANALETFLSHYQTVHVFQQSSQILRTLPAKLADFISLADLPLIGASPDGQTDRDPEDDAADVCWNARPGLLSVKTLSCVGIGCPVQGPMQTLQLSIIHRCSFRCL